MISKFRKKVILFSVFFLMFGNVAQAASINSEYGLLNVIQNGETGSYSNPASVDTGPDKFGNGAHGAFQQRDPALKTIGYMNDDGSWNSQASGVASLDEYKQCLQCQIKGETILLQKDWSAMQTNGATSYVGQTTHGGLVVNESALIECAQALGPTGCSRWLNNDPKEVAFQQANQPNLIKNMAAASTQDPSFITNGQNTSVDNSSIKGGTMSTNAAEAAMLTYCAKEIQDMINQMGAQAIDNSVILASNSATGYTLMNGSGIMDNALKNGTVGQGGSLLGGDTNALSQLLGHAGYESASCLQNMVSGLGITPLFTGIDLKSIINQIANQACSTMQSQFSQLTQPAYQFLNTVSNKVNTGGFMPGMNLASMGGSLSYSSGGGQFGVGNSSVDLNSILNNNSSWYNKINTFSQQDVDTGNSMLNDLVNGRTIGGDGSSSFSTDTAIDALSKLSAGSSPF